MAPDVTSEEIRDKNKSRFNSWQAVRSNPVMSKEAPGGGKSRQQKKKMGKVNKIKITQKSKDMLLTRYNC